MPSDIPNIRVTRPHVLVFHLRKKLIKMLGGHINGRLCCHMIVKNVALDMIKKFMIFQEHNMTFKNQRIFGSKFM